MSYKLIIYNIKFDIPIKTIYALMLIDSLTYHNET